MKRFLVTAIGVLACVGCSGPSVAATSVLVPQRGVGAPYGSRDPLGCASTAEPRSGGISTALARQYFICGWEKVDGNGNLNLTENVQLEVGRGIVPRGDYAVPKADQDPNAKLYAIRGSYDWYMCGKVSQGTKITGLWSGFSDAGNAGKNCTLFHVTNASGECYRTTFGDWKCQMIGTNQQVDGQPPPTS